jgi:hypothetical protein
MDHVIEHRPDQQWEDHGGGEEHAKPGQFTTRRGATARCRCSVIRMIHARLLALIRRGHDCLRDGASTYSA